MFASYDEFHKYGIVLRDTTPAGSELFSQKAPTGWRLAEIPVDNREVTEMSYHDNTPEGFFPVEGITMLKLSADESFEHCETFLLDRPVLINPCIWHGLAALTESSRIIVAENQAVNLVKKSFCKENGMQ